MAKLSLATVSSARTRIERDQAIESGPVDEWQLLVVPIIVGGGKRSLPDGFRIRLELLHERRFDNGTIYLRYRTKDVLPATT
jgi:riboflavin biosynthesis pyrimidine reductase